MSRTFDFALVYRPGRMAAEAETMYVSRHLAYYSSSAADMPVGIEGLRPRMPIMSCAVVPADPLISEV